MKNRANISIILVLIILSIASNFIFFNSNLEATLNKNKTSDLDHSIDSSAIDKAQEQEIFHNIGSIGSYFTENCGQLNNDNVRFYAQGGAVWFTDDGVWYEVKDELSITSRQSRVHSPESRLMTDDYRLRTNECKRVILKQEFVGANHMRPLGVERLSWNNNYFYGNDSTKWCTDVPNYQEIIYENIYDKVDLRYYSPEQGLKYDFIVHPGGEPSDIRIKYEGVQELCIDPSGNLEIKTQLGNILDSDLFIYQDLNNNEKVIDGRFKILAPRTYGFKINGNYNKNKAIIIDPLVYSTFIGGQYGESGNGIAVDNSGNAYVSGHTNSQNFPTTPGAYDNTLNGSDCFVLKLNSNGAGLIYSTFIGGNDHDRGDGIVVDEYGSAYVTGHTKSSDFPTTSGANDTTHNGVSDVFILKLNRTGAALKYSTYIGGNYGDVGTAIAIDTVGNAYVTGYTYSSDFPTTSGANDTTHNGVSDIFILKLNQTGAALIYSTFIGGSDDERENSIVVDTSGNAYVTGLTNSSDFPTTKDAYADTYNGGFWDGFVIKLNKTGSSLTYSTYIGGSGRDYGTGIAVDISGNTYVTGATWSSDFPTTQGAYDNTFNGTYDSFVLKLNQTGAALIYSTYIGGSSGEVGEDISVDGDTNAYVAGGTWSSDFPTTPGAYDQSFNGGFYDVFVLKLTNTGSALIYSTYIGGNVDENCYDIAIDIDGYAYGTGFTVSSNFPTTTGAFDTSFNGGSYDGFILKIKTPSSHLFLSSPKVTPYSGNTSTEFNFTVQYVHINNKSPSEVKVFIDDIEHSMKEVNSADVTYFDGKEFFHNIRHLDIGEHTYRFWASNSTNFTITPLENNLIVENTPPEIITQDNLTAIEDTYYEVSYEFSDMDVANVGQTCSWNFSSNASWLNFLPESPTLYGTPTNNDMGKYWVNITINDTFTVDINIFTLTVVDVNDKPSITTADVKSTNEDDFYEVDYDAVDIDSPLEKQIWSLETNTNSWLQLNSSSGVLNGTPTNDDVGCYWVNITVNDNEGGFDLSNFTLTIINVNDPPVITTKDITYSRVGNYYEVDYEATDVDNQVSDLAWTIDTNASWLTFDTDSGVLKGTPKFGNIGWYNVNIFVSDGVGGSDWHEFVLNVFNRYNNEPPIIQGVDLKEIMVNSYYEVDYNATDDYTPSDQLIWYLETNATWLSINMATGIISGTPTGSDAGLYWAIITVWDVENGWASHNFTLNVKKEPTTKNLAPILSNPMISPESGDTKTEFTFSVHYYDNESDSPVLIQLVMKDSTYDMELLSGVAANGTYEYTIKLTEGEHIYSFTASDGKNIVNTKRYSTPFIKKEETAKEEASSEGLIIIFIIIVIIVVLLLFLLSLRKRKKKKKESEKSVPPSVQPTEMDQPIYGQVFITTPYTPMQPLPPTTYPPQPQPKLQQQLQLQEQPQISPTQTPIKKPDVYLQSEDSPVEEKPQESIEEIQE